MEGLELIAFQIISCVGSARSYYIESIQKAKNFNFEEARILISKGETQFNEGHHAHAQLIQREAKGEGDTINLLLIHAEDQLMSAEAFGILANEFIDIYKTIEKSSHMK